MGDGEMAQMRREAAGAPNAFVHARDAVRRWALKEMVTADGQERRL